MNQPEHIYKIVLGLMGDSFQLNVYKNKVSKTTDKHYIIAKNNWHNRSVHVDRSVVESMEVSSNNLQLTFLSFSTWAKEDGIEEAKAKLHDAMERAIEKLETTLNEVKATFKEEPVLTERDTTEFD